MIVETVEPLGTRHRVLFLFIETFSVAVFTIEYALRVWAAGEHPRYRGLTGRLRYMATPLAVLDLLAILPYYLTLATVDLRFLRLFRVLRLFRLARLARYSAALRALGRVFVAKRFELGVTFLLGALLLLIAASAMYYVEHDAQPDTFRSIPVTMWWAIATLTTIGMFALPTGILGAAFVDELQRMKLRDAAGTCPTCGRPFDTHASRD